MHFNPCPHIFVIIITINHHYPITITFLLIMIIFLISVVIFPVKGLAPTQTRETIGVTHRFMRLPSRAKTMSV